MRSRLLSARLLHEGKLSGKELRDAEANPVVVAEAKRMAQEATAPAPRKVTRREKI